MRADVIFESVAHVQADPFRMLLREQNLTVGDVDFWRDQINPGRERNAEEHTGRERKFMM